MGRWGWLVEWVGAEDGLILVGCGVFVGYRYFLVRRIVDLLVFLYLWAEGV